jgi:predicted RNA binding protein YcfA (HicA-like mRNA interferase family)
MPLGAKEVIKVLQKHGFEVSRQRGSHIVMRKATAKGKKIGVVPNHKELKRGTLLSISKMTGVDRSKFGL